MVKMDQGRLAHAAEGFSAGAGGGGFADDAAFDDDEAEAAPSAVSSCGLKWDASAGGRYIPLNHLPSGMRPA